MLVKSHLREYAESFGVLSPDRKILTLLDEGAIKTNKVVLASLSPLVAMNLIWLHKDVWVACDVASTDKEKRVGLQSYSSLKDKQGLYFGYPEGCDVTFHQGTVSFPLDLIFLREDEVIQIEANTTVGSEDRWSCPNVDGVIEVNAGFCADNKVSVGDVVAYFANSEVDVANYYANTKGSALAKLAYDLCDE